MKSKITPRFFLQSDFFDLNTLAFYDGKFASSKTMMVYSLILSFHPTVSADIKRVRKLISSVKLPVAYPESPTMESLVALSHTWTNNSDEKDLLNQEIKKIIGKYNLISVWELSLIIKVITDRLPVPYEHTGIEFLYPKKLLKSYEERLLPEKQPSSLRDLSALVQAREIVSQWERVDYPCIVLKEYVKPEKINQFIRSNWRDVIEPVLAKLPKRQLKSRDVDLDRFTFGVWLFVRKRLLRESWDTIEKEIDGLVTADPEFFGGDDGSPSRPECQKIFDDVQNTFNLFHKM